MKEKIKKIFVILLILINIFTLVSCGQKKESGGVDSTENENSSIIDETGKSQETESEETKVEKDLDNIEPKRVVLLVKKLSSTFWTDMQEAAEAKCEEFGWELETLSPTQADNNEEQIQLLEQSLLDPPDIYLIAPADSQGIAPAIELINEAGIPIINVSTKITAEDVEYETFVGVEFYDLAKQAAYAICEKVDNKGNVVCLEGVTGSQSSIDIKQGSEEVFKELGMNILESQPANYVRTDGLQVTQDLLQKHSDIDIVFAANGESALGAAEAIRQSGREDIMIATLNMSEELAQAIKDGIITLTVDDVSWKVGESSVVAAKDYFDNVELPKDLMQEGQVVDATSLDMYEDKYNLQ